MNEETIFATARQLKAVAERQAYLDQACAGDPRLRAQVELLLRADAQAGSVLEHPPAYGGTTDVNRESAATHDWAEWRSFLNPSAIPGRPGKLGAYEVLDLIGRGGMGIVFRGQDVKLNRVVAIKALVPELAANAMARKRFLREAQAAAAVSHDHVVTIHAVEDEGKVPFLVMECIIGQSLQQKIDRVGALQLTEILRIGMQIALGLAAAHKQGLIHRDIKPSNILLENGVERVKITDFGLARAVDDVGITQSGVIAGTPQYMSPEQAMGEPLDHRSDLFSLGSLLYTMCTGRAAFRGDSSIAVIRRVCDDAPRPIRELNPEIPEWLVEVVDRLLAKDPQQRFQSATEVAAILEQYLAQIQQASMSSGHRMLLNRAPELPPATKESRPDKIWSVVGIVSLLIVIYSFSRTVYRDTRSPHPNGPLTSATQAPKPAEAPKAPEAPRPQENLNIAHETPVSVGPLAVAPFDAKQAAQFQEDWAKRLGVPVEFTNKLGMKFRLIPPGEFQMGTSPEELVELEKDLEQIGGTDFDKFVAKSSAPKHVVRLTQPYYMAQHEVTAALFKEYADIYPQPKPKEDRRVDWRKYVDESKADVQPVVGVTWNEAQAFCRWLSQREHLTYDLPTEAQWEYACRAGAQTLWSHGDDPSKLDTIANVGQKDVKDLMTPPAVGQKAANAFGLYDMHGSASEWCLDWHVRDYYSTSPLTEPVSLQQPADPTSGRVTRGGAWYLDAWWSRAAVRNYDFPSNPIQPKGFRVIIRGRLKPPEK